MPSVSTLSIKSHGANGRRAHRNADGSIIHYDDDVEPQPSIWTSWCVASSAKLFTAFVLSFLSLFALSPSHLTIENTPVIHYYVSFFYKFNII